MSIKDLELSKLSLIALCVLAPLLGWLILGERGLLQLYHAEIERQEHLEKIRSLAEENRAMLAEIERLRSDMKYIESLARKELNMVKENETIYRFGNPIGQASRTVESETAGKGTGADDYAGSRIPDRQPR